MINALSQQSGGSVRVPPLPNRNLSGNAKGCLPIQWQDANHLGRKCRPWTKGEYVMPNRDGTGPRSQGPQSGQGGGKGQKQRGPGCRKGSKGTGGGGGGAGPGSGGGMGRSQGSGKQDSTDK
jgi:hypothetical protein